MEHGNENMRFECAFSEKAMKSNALTIIVFTIVMIAVLGYISWNASNTKLSIWLSFFYIVIIREGFMYAINERIKPAEECS